MVFLTRGESGQVIQNSSGTLLLLWGLSFLITLPPQWSYSFSHHLRIWAWVVLCACSAHYHSPIKGIVKFACVGGASCMYHAHGQQLSTTGKETDL